MTTPTLSLLRDRARHWVDRHRLTPQERAHRLAGYTPPAVISASLGYHPPHR